MNKRLIWIIAVIMAITFVALFILQIFYMDNIVDMHREQFYQGVRQSLTAVRRNLEQEETKYFLEDNLSQVQTKSIYNVPRFTAGSEPSAEGVKLTFITSSGLEADLTITGHSNELSKIQTGGIFLGGHYLTMRDAYQDHFLYHKGVLDDVVINIISSASNRSIRERADSAYVENYLRGRLDTVGIHLPFEFAIVNSSGKPEYKTADYNPTSNTELFTQVLFPQSAGDSDRYFLKVYFPTLNNYFYGTANYMIPSLILTLILFAIFVITIIVAFRQKKLSEVKSDFINSMTHEFKTPLSSISLAAQMLNDPDIRMSPSLLKHISTVIRDETKRLRFQVDKVLQISLFEREEMKLNKDEVDANSLVQNVANTYVLKVVKYGGKLNLNLDAPFSTVLVDEMHFSNVIFNLLDNAIKYRSEDRPLEIDISSQDIDDDTKLQVVISDNGIGIRHEYIKKIFDKFYRVPTGNLHDVKGFGLGLAYVKTIIRQFGGEITVESEFNVGTKFIITLPLLKV